ncbi:MazG family protein [Pedococcus sp. NPDC057267]|uniref:MazG family protein n=1 Tax=Pedococcus sp. NPDC057267 TaxID=3346077 RepID=UPI0036384D3C
MAGRLSLLVASPRVAPGLLSRSAWQAVEAADHVLARGADEPLAAALVESGVSVAYAGDVPPPALARDLVARAGEGRVVWVSSADADPGLTDAVAAEVSRLPEPPEVEVVVGSWDVQGARLLDVVAVMDRLRSPGGCPWDAEQTHESLVKYLVEESHEAAEAIESGDRDHMREELGDVLLQVAFQSRVAEEHPDQPFDIDDVAGGLVAKLVRRHPHVFADDAAATPEEVERNWELIKAQERAAKAEHAGGEAGHAGLLHGIPASLPALLAADKVVARLERRGDSLPAAGEDVASQLLALVARARAEGTDAEAELRRALRRLDQQA